EVTLTLSSAGTAAVRALGAPWLLAAVRSLEAAYPDRGIELVLRTSSSEPMPEGGAIQPASAGGMFLGGDGVGRLSVRRDAVTTPVWRVLQLPTPELLAHDGSFTFIAPTAPIRRRAGSIYSALYDRAPVLLDTWRQNPNHGSPSSRPPLPPRSARPSPLAGRTATPAHPGPPCGSPCTGSRRAARRRGGTGRRRSPGTPATRSSSRRTAAPRSGPSSAPSRSRPTSTSPRTPSR